MKDKKLAILLLILALLLGIYFFYGDENKNFHLDLDKTFNPEEIEAILIQKGDSLWVSLNREGKSWYLGEKRYLADSEKVARLVDVYVSMKGLELISNDEQNAAYYNLSEDKAYRVTFSTKKEKFEYNVSPDEGRSSYLLYKKKIYQYNKNLNSYFASGEESLREKRLFLSDKKEISFFSLHDASKTYSFTRKDDVWTSSDFDGKVLNEENIEAYLQILTTTVVNRFDEKTPIEEYNKKQLIRKIDVTLKDGQRIVLDFREAREKEGDQRLFVSHRKSLVYIGAYYSETLMQDVSKFLK